MTDTTLDSTADAVAVEPYCVQPGQRVKLAELDPRTTEGFDGKKHDGKQKLAELTERLEALQEILYAQRQHKVLIVLQAMDTGGKDSTIRHVFEGVNPAGVRVASFKAPTPEELAHDYLWRVHKHTPGNGEMVIFNRSHYEDVLVVRVHQLVDAAVWGRRYEHICAFEQMLADEGTTILKFFLHISKNEQKERLQAASGRSHQTLEVRHRRFGRTQTMGRVYGGVRGDAQPDQHGGRALVYRARRPQVVPQPGDLADNRQHAGRAAAGLSTGGAGAGRGCDRLGVRSSLCRPNLRRGPESPAHRLRRAARSPRLRMRHRAERQGRARRPRPR